MLKAPLPLTGECSDSESDDEGAGYLNGYSSSDDDSFHRGRGLKGAEPLDYDDGAGLADTAKASYKAMSKKTMDTIKRLTPYASEISKKLTSPMAMKIGMLPPTLKILTRTLTGWATGSAACAGRQEMLSSVNPTPARTRNFELQADFMTHTLL
jgi:hypothetical protein